MGFFKAVFDLGRKVPRDYFYLTGLVDCLQDDMRMNLKGRIEGYDYFMYWYRLVPFILFTIRVAHTQADKRSQEVIEAAIEQYIHDVDNPDGYLQFYGSNELAQALRHPDRSDMIKEVEGLYWDYVRLYNECVKSGARIGFSLDMYLAETMATDTDRRHTYGMFDWLMRNFTSGDLKLYKA